MIIQNRIASNFKVRKIVGRVMMQLNLNKKKIKIMAEFSLNLIQLQRSRQFQNSIKVIRLFAVNKCLVEICYHMLRKLRSKRFSRRKETKILVKNLFRSTDSMLNHIYCSRKTTVVYGIVVKEDDLAAKIIVQTSRRIWMI